MIFTFREEYGLLAVTRLAMNQSNQPMQAKEIARLENIPEPFLKQILLSLTKAGIIKSIRGASGGYMINRSANLISSGDVIRALGGEYMPSHQSSKSEISIIDSLSEKIRNSMVQVLDSTTIRDMVNERENMNSDSFIMMNI